MLILILTLFTSFSFAGWPEFIRDLDKHFPDSALILQWQLNREYVDGKERSRESIQDTPVSCPSKKLWPTHPQQTTKDYLFAVWAHYDHGRLPPGSYACQTRNPQRTHCLRATTANLIIMSDTYLDECGNSYRGYWLTSFLATDENMGTLSSRGRTFYVDDNGGNFQLGHTYPATENDFVLLGPLLPGDSLAIRKGRDEAFKLGMKLKGLQWEPRP